ncbi:MAG: hypothetical protein ACLQQ4_07865 [Bacteroidia bacterium]
MSVLHYIFGDKMLSEVIRSKIEERAGRIRYSRDCEALSEKILAHCKCSISSSTLQRLFGFVKSKKQPRAYTLDILAAYLDYSSWDELLLSLNNKAVENKEIRELKPGALKKGQKFELTYLPNTEIVIEYIGKYLFRVHSAKNSRLRPGDVFKASVITLHHPLFILDIEGTSGKEGRLIEGKISGITSIKKL